MKRNGKGAEVLPPRRRITIGACLERLDLFDNRRRINAEVREQLFRLAGTRDAANGELVDFDAFCAELARDCVAQPAFGIMIFHGDDGALCL